MESSFVREPTGGELSISVDDFDELPAEVQEAVTALAAVISESAAAAGKKRGPGEKLITCNQDNCQPLKSGPCAFYVSCHIVNV